MRKEFTKENIMSFLKERESYYTGKYNYHFENKNFQNAKMCGNMKLATQELMMEIEEYFE